MITIIPTFVGKRNKKIADIKIPENNATGDKEVF